MAHARTGPAWPRSHAAGKPKVGPDAPGDGDAKKRKIGFPRGNR